MAAVTITVDVPQTVGFDFDQEALRRQLSAMARLLVSTPVLRRADSEHEDIHIFDELHTDWGGDADVDELASSLRNSSTASRTVETW